MNKKRVEFLQRVYDAAGGTEDAVARRQIGEAMGLPDDAHVAVIQYLQGEGLLDWIAQGFVKLTHRGIVHVEEMRQGRSQKGSGRGFFPNINIGTLNVTGTANLGQIVGNIEQRITQINNSGNTTIAASIKDFAQAVVDDAHLDLHRKEEVLEYLSTIAEEAEKEPAKRKKGLTKTVLLAIPELVKTSASLLTLWDRLSAQLYALFELVK